MAGIVLGIVVPAACSAPPPVATPTAVPAAPTIAATPTFRPAVPPTAPPPTPVPTVDPRQPTATADAGDVEAAFLSNLDDVIADATDLAVTPCDDLVVITRQNPNLVGSI